MNKFLLPLFALLILIPHTSSAQDTPLSEMPTGAYELDKSHAFLIWKVSHLGMSTYIARFTDFDADLTLDPINPENSGVSVTVNPLSVETDYPNPEKKDFDQELATGQDWFNGGEFGEITFTSTKLTPVEGTDNQAIMTGTLDFLGQQHPLDLTVTFNGAMAEHPFAKKPALGFSAVGTLDRTTWGLDTYAPNIGTEVELEIEVEFFKATEE